jgi:hypothetical protein
MDSAGVAAAKACSPIRLVGSRALLAIMLLATCCYSRAQTLAPQGCPIFHCTAEATGVVYQPIVKAVLTTNSSTSLGTLPSQGCSGNGIVLTCLFAKDEATGTAAGTLKVLDATTLEPIWGSAGAANSYNLAATSAAGGQVPVNFANGTIAAGDAKNFVLYGATGAVLGNLPLVGGKNKNFGLTPLSATYGVVSQENGLLTLINMATWQNIGSLTLRDPVTNAQVALVSPSSGTAGVLYAIAQNPANGRGYLYSVVLNAATNQLSVGSVFEFTGAAGASPVVVTPAVTGLSANLVLLPVPGLIGDPIPKNRLLALLDSPASGLTPGWEIELPAPITVAPTIDQASMSLFYHDNNTPIIYQNDLITGTQIGKFNIRTIGGYPMNFKLNGHLGASESGGPFTLLLAGEYTTSPGVGAQLVLTFQPLAMPRRLVWATQISSVPAGYLAAWNFAPASEPGVVCPVALSETDGNSAIIRLCDH